MVQSVAGPSAGGGFPAPLQCLFVPKRYKVLYGGRGAAKSWGVARALLIMGCQRKLTVLCARELQKSIEDSVHKLLSNQILNKPTDAEEPGLDLARYYRIEKQKIYGANGTVFSFEGIKNNINGIRSYEGVDIVWVEEANNVSENSWTVLIPTIRKEGSEIWLTFNPELETDYTYQRFVLDSDLVVVDGQRRFSVPVACPMKESSEAICVHMSWRDNPWFPEVLYREMERDKKKDYDQYLHIWEGKCIANLKGAIYAKELRAAMAEGRITRVPYDRSIPVDTFWDLGRADSTAIWFIQRVGMQWRVLAYYEASLEDLTHYFKELQKRGYLYGTMFLPHDAEHKRLGYKNSIEEQFKLKGYRTHVVPRMLRVDGINMTRQVFPQCWFDELECKAGLNALRNYQYEVGSDGKFKNEPLHNWASDGADAFRTFACSVRVARDSEGRAERLVKRLTSWTRDAASPRSGLDWLR